MAGVECSVVMDPRFRGDDVKGKRGAATEGELKTQRHGPLAERVGRAWCRGDIHGARKSLGAPQPQPTPLNPGSLSPHPSPKGRREKPVRHPGTASVIPGTASVIPGTASVIPGTASVIPGTASVIPNLIGNPLYGGCGVLRRHGSPLSRG